jgi:hypothetical protein
MKAGLAMLKTLVLFTLLLAATSANAQYYMPYNVPVAFGPTQMSWQYGYNFQPMSRYDRIRWYQYRYNRPYILNGRRLTPVGGW